MLLNMNVYRETTDDEHTVSIPPTTSESEKRTVSIPPTTSESEKHEVVRTVEFNSVTLNGKSYRASPPLSFVCTTLVSPEPGLTYLTGDFDILLAHESSEELFNRILPELLEYLWEEYALEDTSMLDGRARDLGEELRARFAEQT